MVEMVAGIAPVSRRLHSTVMDQRAADSMP